MLFVLRAVIYVLGDVTIFGTGMPVRKLNRKHFMTALSLVSCFGYVWEHIQFNSKIPCIKAHRQMTGLGLSESKDIVELAAMFFLSDKRAAEQMLYDWQHENRNALEQAKLAA